ncbi:ECF RNA polymerase sigma factor SigW [Ruminiclostridium hungatei]|uniref:ECF RNA polymerase sigma factor SigW n=1 Tax=Ruminiclostridium hungatei TaxID=48256 RepID=A0A1V4SFB3_RUMHU|nr:RNA polymerase sigma factor [Ruminiclostridium hungatei]OPX42558.1 ECF RNA polymerase sigma factor SigW [Ruminiclostridium hungatei]
MNVLIVKGDDEVPFLSGSPEDDLENAYSRYGNMLFKLCFVILSNTVDAEDALQDTFLRYINKRPVFNEPEHEKAWFIKVANNVCKDMRRFKLRHNTLHIDELSDYCSGEDQGHVLEQILTLPPKYKIVIHLYYIEGYNVEEIARIIDLSRSAVKMRLLRGRKLLKVELEEENQQ